MENILQTTDFVLLSFARSLLNEEGIESYVFDQHISLVEGSVGVFAQRLSVPRDSKERACRHLVENGLKDHLIDDKKRRP
jgi:hypothetical protein